MGIAAGAAMTLSMSGAALAGGHGFEPTKPIDFVIMAGKGGGADKMARLMQSIIEQESLSERPVVPTNQPGGSRAEAPVHLHTCRLYTSPSPRHPTSTRLPSSA